MSLDLNSGVSASNRHRPFPRRSRAALVAVNPYADSRSDSRQRTEGALTPLRELGWSVTHGAADGLEHLAIGGAGAFAIESHAAAGPVRIDGDQVTVTVPGMDCRSVPSDAWAYDARLRAALANRLFHCELSQRVPVAAVVVIWGEFAQRVVEGHHVTFVHGDEVTAWLQSRASRFSVGRVAELAAALRPDRHGCP